MRCNRRSGVVVVQAISIPRVIVVVVAVVGLDQLSPRFVQLIFVEFTNLLAAHVGKGMDWDTAARNKRCGP